MFLMSNQFLNSGLKKTGSSITIILDYWLINLNNYVNIQYNL